MTTLRDTLWWLLFIAVLWLDGCSSCQYSFDGRESIGTNRPYYVACDRNGKPTVACDAPTLAELKQLYAEGKCK